MEARAMVAGYRRSTSHLIEPLRAPNHPHNTTTGWTGPNPEMISRCPGRSGHVFPRRPPSSSTLHQPQFPCTRNPDRLHMIPRPEMEKTLPGEDRAHVGLRESYPCEVRNTGDPPDQVAPQYHFSFRDKPRPGALPLDRPKRRRRFVLSPRHPAGNRRCRF